MAAWPLLLVLLFQVGLGCRQRLLLPVNSSLQTIVSNPSGSSVYLENRQCSWLLQAPENSTVMLWFDDYATECNYDFLFIYDGPSRSSPMLAALSGEIPFSPLSSSTSQMLLVFYSDLNYPLRGFSLSTAAISCSNCSEHSTCQSGKCLCDVGWSGPLCTEASCPQNCSGRGTCAADNSRCVCQSGYAGPDCNQTLALPSWQSFTPHPSSVFAPRAAHASAHDPAADILWVHGGYNLNRALDDLLFYSFATGQWSRPPAPTTRPAARYSHSLVSVQGQLVLFGGVVGQASFYANGLQQSQSSSSTLSAETWVYSTTNNSWSLLPLSPSSPPALASHTATVADTLMVVLGGRGLGPQYSRFVYVLNTSTWLWSRISPTGPSNVQFAGHSSVYHAPTNTIVVHGGFVPFWAGYSDRSSQTWLYSVAGRVWTKIDVTNPDVAPTVAFHSAVVQGWMLLVWGGGQHAYYYDSSCFSNDLHVFDLASATWLPSISVANVPPARMSHTALLRGREMTIVGGFRGTVLSEVATLSLPADWCDPLSETSCTAHGECAWCPTTATCASIAANIACNSTPPVSTDPGSFCGTLETCASCAGAAPCSWCPLTLECLARASAPTCGSLLVNQSAQCNALPPGSVRGLLRQWWVTQDDYLNSPTQPGGFDVISQADSEFQSSTRYEIMSARITPPSPGQYQFNFILSETGTASLVDSTTGTRMFLVNASSTRTVTLSSTTVYLFTSNAISTNSGDFWNFVTWSGPGLPSQVLGAPYCEPPSTNNCTQYSSCLTCAMDSACGWCNTTCMPRLAAASCPVSLATEQSACTVCSEHTDCRTCTTLGCGWMYDSCIRINNAPTLITNTTACPRRCFDRTTCNECLAPDTTHSSLLCGWCASSNQCFDFGQYTAADSLGQCAAWFRSDGNPCPSCALAPTTPATGACGTCLGQTDCGWSYLSANPLRGQCTDGGFVGPVSMLPLLSSNDVSTRVSVFGNGSTAIEALNMSIAWAFLTCPLINECALGIANCSANSTCVDLPVLFNCTCAPGYRATGTGFPGSAANPCLPVCSSCANGRCIAPETCSCFPGWAGTNCTLDCGCNQHAVCPANFTAASNASATVCGPCLNNTMGSRCESCLPGFFGDARRGGVCTPCQCNGHGNASRGLCNSTTGACFCLDYTQGTTCSICLPNFYGTPLNGSMCYSQATINSRVEMFLPRGGLGTGLATGYLSNSLATWLIRAPNTSLITLTFSRLATECSYDYIHIYDAISPLAPGARLLATFSGLNTPPPLYSRTGSLLVMFFSDEDFELSGFEAIYTIRTCSEYCRNGTCVDSTCVCYPGYTGTTCAIASCPHNCSASQGWGACAPDGTRCICEPGYLGLGCNQPVANATWAALPAAPHGPFTPRSGHCAVYDARADAMVVFGGYDLNAYLSDVLQYDFAAFAWSTLATHTPTTVTTPATTTAVSSLVGLGAGGTGTTDPAGTSTTPSSFLSSSTSNTFSTTVNPSSTSTFTSSLDPTTPPSSQPVGPAGRHLHTCVLYDDQLVVYGGETGPSQRASDMWFFDLASNTWSLYVAPPTATFSPPQVMGHAAVVAGADMYVFGGLVRGIGFYTALYKFNFVTQLWALVPALGNPLATFGLTGLYYPPRNSLVFYGGRRQFSSNTAERTSAVREYLIDSNTWVADAQYSPDCVSRANCNGRQLASAVLQGDLMIIFGGNPFEHMATTECSTNTLLVYNLACQMWLINATVAPNSLPSMPCRRAAHKAILRNSTLVVAGGYAGTVMNTLYAYPIPPSYCSLHTLRNVCVWDPQCAWHESARICFASSLLTSTSNLTNITVASTCLANTCPMRTMMADAIDLCNLCTSGPCTYCSRNGECAFSNATSTTCAASSQVTALPQCNRCTSRTSCADCALAGCQWSSQPGCIAGPPTNISTCPARCSSITSCDTCRRTGSCSWCSATNTCMPLYTVTTEYSFGQCLRYTTSATCDLNSVCTARLNCSSCLATPYCGWCSDPLSLASNTTGSCAAGTAYAPGLFSLSSTSTCSITSPLRRNTTWSAFVCPDINECLLNTHRCTQNATCVNEDPSIVRDSRGYRCVCPPLYELNADGLSCRPTCLQSGCVRGTCVAPNTCQCALGWTGANCSTDCGCNFHSTCEGGVGVCDSCRDSTTGSRCEQCAPNFFGNATNGGQCLTCNATCNGHATSCSTRNGLVFCNNCSGNTIGRLCDVCDTGYFLDPALIIEARRRGLTPRQYVDTTNANVSCVPCQCNMHATTCNADTGEGCPCGDNTFTRAQDCPSTGCYGSQCAACLPTVSINHVDLQLDGYPVNGHMCYLVPSGDATFDLTINAGDVQPFLIIPRYTNVDIRIALDLDTARADQLTLQISTDSNITRNTSGLLTFRTPPFYSSTFRGRLSVAIRSDNFDFDLEHFYVIIRSASTTTISYRATFLQPLVSIDLFVFFAVFFSSFFLFLAVVAIAFKVKTRFEERAAQQAAAMQMEAMAHRPLASSLFLLGPPVDGPRAASLAAAIEGGHLPVRPLSVQPLINHEAEVTSYLVELPMRGQHRTVCLASALTATPPRRPRGRAARSTRVSSSAV